MKRSTGVIFWFMILFISNSTSNLIAQDTLSITFGSCNKANLDQSFWKVIDQEPANTWVWLGDIVYADTKKAKSLKKSYRELTTNPFYSEFRLNNRIYGIWDDHDYGENDGGKSYKVKAQSKKILFDFLSMSKSHPAYDHVGAYQSHVIDENGITAKLILLDVRYFRDELKNNPEPKIRYLPDENAEMLGVAQWKWLEQELKNASEDVIIIGSGSQVIPEEHPFEKWADYPTERKRFFDLIKQFSNKKIVLLSGDRHMAEVSAIAIDKHLFLYEITSSGLTHSWTKGGTEPNGYRIRSLCPNKNYGLLSIIKKDEEIYTVALIKSIDGSTFDTYEIFPQ